MKKIMTGSLIGLMVVLMSAGLVLAGNGYGGGGQGGGGQGTCGGTGISIVCTGTPVTITGMVSDVSYTGSGMVVTTGSEGSQEDVVIYGIGPYRYWESQGVDRPDVGELVAVSGMEVSFNGVTRIIAMAITVNESTEIKLREECVDGVGGWPLWRGGRQGQLPQ